jgi:hypothetical protein
MVEILDFGYPQNSDIDALKMYITTESIKSERAVVSSVDVGFDLHREKIRHGLRYRQPALCPIAEATSNIVETKHSLT